MREPLGRTEAALIAKLVVWNTEWGLPSSRRGQIILEQILAEEPDVLCLTESVTDFPPACGYAVASAPDYGYRRARPDRRKVILWSREPWQHVDSVGAAGLPSGRFVEASTRTPVGTLFVTGVCVPWRDAHVRTGRQDRRPWEDHMAFLNAVAPLIRRPRTSPALLAGDFNQRVPPLRIPAQAAGALARVLEPMRLATEGKIPGLGVQSIDHVALSRDLFVQSVQGLPTVHAGIPLSDHPGIVVCFGVPESAA